MSKTTFYLLRNGKCFWFELAGLLGLAEKLAYSLILSELFKSSGPLLLKSSGGGMGLIFLIGCLIQWLVITVRLGIVSLGSHLDTLPSTVPKSGRAAIFYEKFMSKSCVDKSVKRIRWRILVNLTNYLASPDVSRSRQSFTPNREQPLFIILLGCYLPLDGSRSVVVEWRQKCVINIAYYTMCSRLWLLTSLQVNFSKAKWCYLQSVSLFLFISTCISPKKI